MMNWLLFYFTTKREKTEVYFLFSERGSEISGDFTMNTAACGGNKKARLRPRPISALPPPNCWQALCAAREKIAHAGENLSENTVLVLEVGLEPTKPKGS